MRKLGTIALFLLIAISLSAEPVKPSKSAPLAMSEGSVHIGVGINGWHGSYHSFSYFSNGVTASTNWSIWGPAVTFAVDAGTAGGMFTFGGDVTVFFDQSFQYFTYTAFPWNSTHDVTAWGIAPLFRFGFHPFGIPSLKGKVAVGNVLDPYVGLRIGASIGVLDTRGELFVTGYDEVDVDGDFVFTPTIGLRYYPHKVVGLWTEIDLTSFLFAITFKM